MSLYERVLDKLKKRKEIIESGGINCIPSPFKRYRNTFIGVEQGKYITLTAATKGYKSQFSSYLFIYNSVLYAYNNPDKVKVNILYFPLEETPEAVIERFMCHLIYIMSKTQIRITPQNLRSTDENNPLPDEIIDLLESDEYKRILTFFIDSVKFYNETNPTGIYNVSKDFIKDQGTITYKDQPITDKITGKVSTIKAFDYFTPNSNNVYNLIYIDHIGLISTERGLDLRESMNKLSEYLVILRNRYNFTPIVIQQQVFNETMDAFKLNKLKPTVTGLADSKYTARDSNIVMGLFTPYNYELKDYMGYDVTIFKKNLTFLEVLVNRDGESNNVAPLYVDGGVTYFNELPLPNDSERMSSVYRFIENLRLKEIKNN